MINNDFGTKYVHFFKNCLIGFLLAGDATKPPFDLLWNYIAIYYVLTDG